MVAVGRENEVNVPGKLNESPLIKEEEREAVREMKARKTGYGWVCSSMFERWWRMYN